MNPKPPRTASSRQRGRSKAKEKFWRGVLGQWAAGGQGVRAFCRTHDLSEPSFYAWRRTLAGRGGWASASSSRPPAFVPVQVTPDTPARIEIVLTGGRRIVLWGPVDRGVLAEVLAVLEPASPQEG